LELVTRKYLVQQAIAAKLDREPSVLLDLLRAREQVLAKAFAMRELSRQVSAMTAADTDKYIANHPLRFAQRKVLGIEQIAFAMGAVDQALIDEMAHGGSIDEIDQRLTDMGIGHAKSSATVNTSEISDELLRSIQNKKPGEVGFAHSGQNGLFFSIKTQELRPLQAEAAVALARQLQHQELAKAQASLTNFTAKMEAKFEGDYARIMTEHSEAAPITN
jgi:EpsD family peptidyl-prolyl cis-trans isomerase